jgi:hypothetical protein
MAKGIKKAKGAIGKSRARRQETKAERAAREDAAEHKVHVVRMISAAALRRAVTDINSILEHNSEQAGTIGEIKRATQEKGMDGVALGLLVRLWRKGQNNAVKLRQILDSFDYGRDALKLDDLKAADLLLDKAVGKRRSKKEAAEIDPNQVDADFSEVEVPENVHSLEERRMAEAS